MKPKVIFQEFASFGMSIEPRPLKCLILFPLGEKPKVKSELSKPLKEEPSQVKSKVKSEIRSPIESQVSLPGPDVKGETPGHMKSQIVMVNTAPIWSSRNDIDSGIGQDQKNSDFDNSKKLRVVRKVAVKGVDAAGDETGRKAKDRKSVEMYKPPTKQGMLQGCGNFNRRLC